MSKIVNLKSVRKHWYHIETPQLIFNANQIGYSDGLHN